MKILQLTLSKLPFDFMVNGLKNHEYRNESKWIISRLINENGEQNKFTHIKFTNGYGKDKPYFIAEYIGFEWAFDDNLLIYRDDKLGVLSVEVWAGMQQAESLRNPMVQQGNKKLNEKRIHPCHKPTLLYKKLAIDFDLKGKKVFCGHNGSGSDRIAFDDYVEEFIACEISSEYFLKQEDRYKTYKYNIKLF